jgi:hypothetical protein
MSAPDNAWLPEPPREVQCPLWADMPGKLCRYVEAFPRIGLYEYRCAHCHRGVHVLAPAEAMRLHMIAEMHAREGGER